MPKLDTFTLEIKTGAKPGPEVPHFEINGFPLEFDEREGTTEAGGTIVLKGFPHSFPHSLALTGPEEGKESWEIASILATYECGAMEPYEIRMGAVTLGDDNDLNIWHEPPLPTFDV
ncbi:MAG: helicase [Candidatus Hydrogenedentota bacterium]|nr:MAG: helicase [Candidatus Hydrogenedentota bacterium]